MTTDKDTGSLSLGSIVRLPVWVLLLMGVPGVGGLALGGTQLVRSPGDMGSKLDHVVEQVAKLSVESNASVAKLSTDIATLTAEVRLRDRIDEERRNESARRLDKLEDRVRILETRHKGER